MSKVEAFVWDGIVHACKSDNSDVHVETKYWSVPWGGPKLETDLHFLHHLQEDTKTKIKNIIFSCKILL